MEEKQSIIAPGGAGQPLSLLILLLFCLALYAAFLPMPELRASDESLYAAIAGQMIADHQFLSPHFQGMPIRCFPLYPWLAALSSMLFPAPSWGEPLSAAAVRLPALLSLAGIALVAGIAACRYRSRNAGVMTAAIVLGCMASLKVGLTAQNETLHAFLLTTAWFLWYDLGQQRQKWSLAWGLSLGVVFIDMLNTGLAAPVQFYIPLLCATRPPRLKRQLQKGRHLFWAIFYAFIFAVWVIRFCNQPVFSWDSAIAQAGGVSGGGFFRHLFVFPAKCLLYLLPWGIFFWAPFCLALHPLEPRGSCCSFFRAVVFCLAICAWLSPRSSPLSLLTVLGPMAFLISMNAELIIHRNERLFRRIGQWLAGAAVAAALAAALFCAGAATGHIRIGDHPAGENQLLLAAMAMLPLAAALAAALENRRPRPPAMGITIAAMAIVLSWRCVAMTTTCLAVPDRTYAARQLLESSRRLAPDDQPRLLYIATGRAYPVQCHLLGVPVRRISQPSDELPDDAPVVYLLSNRHPLAKKRNWTAISAEVDMNALRDWHYALPDGDRTPLTITRQPIPDDMAREYPRYLPPEKCRLYRGTLIN